MCIKKKGMKIDKPGSPNECVSTKYTAVSDNIKLHWSHIKLGRYKNNSDNTKAVAPHPNDIATFKPFPALATSEPTTNTSQQRIQPPVLDASMSEPMDIEMVSTPKAVATNTGLTNMEIDTTKLPEDGTSESVTHDDATVIGANKKDKVETKGLFMDLQLIVPAVKMNEATKKAEQSSLSILAERLRSWFDEIQSVEPSFRLLNVDPNTEEPEMLHISKNHNWDKLTEIKTFFRGVRPKKEGGRIYTRIRASFHGPPTELLANVGWFHQERKEYFSIASLQCFQSAVIGFLLYTLRHTDPEPLLESIKAHCDKPVSMRWMRIADGSKYDPNKDTSEDPRALHIECASEDLAEVKDTVRNLWGSSVTQFPLGTQYRFVAQRSSLLDTESITKFEKLLNRQAAWIAQHGGIMREDIYGIDSIIPNTKMTLRQAMMNIKASSGMKTTPLIYAIDRRWNKLGYNFSFHPDKYDEGCRKVKGLVPILLAQFSEEQIRGFFSPRAMSDGKRLEYNTQTGAVTSADDREIEALLGEDNGMASLKKSQSTKNDTSTNNMDITFGNRTGTTLTRERAPDTDSVSTLGRSTSKITRPNIFNFNVDTNHPTGAKPEATTMDNLSTSTASSLSLGSKYTMHTRISDIESKFSTMNSAVENVEGNMRVINNKMDSLTTLLHNLVQSGSTSTNIGINLPASGGITRPPDEGNATGTGLANMHDPDPAKG